MVDSGSVYGSTLLLELLALELVEELLLVLVEVVVSGNNRTIQRGSFGFGSLTNGFCISAKVTFG